MSVDKLANDLLDWYSWQLLAVTAHQKRFLPYLPKSGNFAIDLLQVVLGAGAGR